MTATSIYWIKPDFQTLMGSTALREHMLGHPQPNVITIRLIIQAQDYLPPFRRRTQDSIATSMHTPGPSKRLMHNLQQAAMETSLKLAKAPVAEAPVVKPAAQAAPVPQPSPVQQILAGVESLVTAAVTKAAKDLIQQMRENDQRLLDQTVRQAIVELLGSQQDVPGPPDLTVQTAAKALDLESSEAHPARPRVDVLGLLGAQEHVVRDSMDPHFDLRFIGTDRAAQKITAPTAILVTKFINHSVQERARKSGAKIVYANGAAASVVEQLKGMMQ